MSNGTNRTSIFLSIVIIFLLVAMGVYGFIYRDKLVEFFQKFQKKNEQVEKHTIYNNESLAENTQSDEKVPPKNQQLGDIPAETKEDPKSEIESMVYENVPGDTGANQQRNTQKKSKLEFKNNIPESEIISTPPDSQASRLEFVKKSSATKLSRKNKKTGKKIIVRGKKSNSKLSLYRRINRLERALGIKSNRKMSLEKRIERLEKKLKKN